MDEEIKLNKIKSSGMKTIRVTRNKRNENKINYQDLEGISNYSFNEEETNNVKHKNNSNIKQNISKINCII